MEKGPVDKRYLELAEKWMKGSITPEEEKEFNIWYMDGQHEPAIIDEEFNEHSSRMFSRTLHKAGIPTNSTKKRKPVLLWASAAAAIFIAIITIVYFSNRASGPRLERFTQQLVPGSNKAYLTLQNGKRIALSDQVTGTLSSESGIRIRKAADGLLVYEVEESKTTADQNAFNTLETPKAGQYKIILPDQTAVWLNAASSITFPSSFAALKERRVILNGEAYFEVHKDADRPFFVVSGNQEIRVLGTHFNVSAYATDLLTSTTLLEGSISLDKYNGNQTGNQMILKPGDQAVNDGSSVRIAQVDPEYAIAWKEGKFRFKNENIRTLMEKVSRWYDIEVRYEGDVSQKNFSGLVSRTENIAVLLNILESTNTIHFKIEGRRITVMP